MQKHDWMAKMSSSLDNGHIFSETVKTKTPATLLFACDAWRRRKHDVVISIEANQSGESSLSVVIHPKKSSIDLTIRHTETSEDILKSIRQTTKKIRIRGCGSVVNTVYQVIDSLINQGWYLEQTMLNSSTHKHSVHNQVNTTLQAVLRRG